MKQASIFTAALIGLATLLMLPSTASAACGDNTCDDAECASGSCGADCDGFTSPPDNCKPSGGGGGMPGDDEGGGAPGDDEGGAGPGDDEGGGGIPGGGPGGGGPGGDEGNDEGGDDEGGTGGGNTSDSSSDESSGCSTTGGPVDVTFVAMILGLAGMILRRRRAL
ncbi:MAG: hypothetical protein AMXMBFR64_35970 [Myxococcales bacterium]